MQRLQAVWVRLPQSLRFGLAAASALVTILSFPTLADGVAGWGDWLAFVGSTAASYIFPTLGLLGLAICGSLQIAELRARKRSSVLADIEHRDGCPREPVRMETWTQTREWDGIEVTVGKCNDCGRMAYRYGDTPIAPPSTPAPAERSVQPQDMLTKALSEGLALRSWSAAPRMINFDEDLVYQWARDTYRLLCEYFPKHADAFYGASPVLDVGHFVLGYTAETKRLGGRHAYLESRIDLLKGVVI